jgi:hypothetical protein
MCQKKVVSPKNGYLFHSSFSSFFQNSLLVIVTLIRVIIIHFDNNFHFDEEHHDCFEHHDFDEEHDGVQVSK